jgi:hypothetical protein
MGCDGGVVSEDGGDGAGSDDGWHGAVATVSVACRETLPAASLAATANPYEVPQERPVWLAEVELGEATLVPLRYTS